MPRRVVQLCCSICKDKVAVGLQLACLVGKANSLNFFCQEPTHAAYLCGEIATSATRVAAPNKTEKTTKFPYRVPCLIYFPRWFGVKEI